MQLASQFGRGGGQIDFDTFSQIVSRSQDDATSDEEIFQAFQVFDEAGDGSITIAALRNILTMLGAEKMTASEFDELLKKCKLGGDASRVNYRSFMQTMRAL